MKITINGTEGTYEIGEEARRYMNAKEVEAIASLPAKLKSRKESAERKAAEAAAAEVEKENRRLENEKRRAAEREARRVAREKEKADARERALQEALNRDFQQHEGNISSL